MWFFNVWLYLFFIFAPQDYQALVAGGAPCYNFQASLGNSNPNEQPFCFYDPSNTNPGN